MASVTDRWVATQAAAATLNLIILRGALYEVACDMFTVVWWQNNKNNIYMKLLEVLFHIHKTTTSIAACYLLCK